MLSVLNDMMEFAFTGAWGEGDGNDVVWLIASEVSSFDDGDNDGGNEVDGNEDECNEDGFVELTWYWFHLLDGAFYVIIIHFTITVWFWYRSWIFVLLYLVNVFIAFIIFRYYRKCWFYWFYISKW